MDFWNPFKIHIGAAFKKGLKGVLGYTPDNIELYRTALTHRSIKEAADENNERLEYLGDAILSALVADYLFKRYPYKEEGFLTEMRSKMVNRQKLNDIAIKMGLKNYSFFKIAEQYPLQEINYFPVGTKLIIKHSFIARLNNDIGHNFLSARKTKNELNRLKKKSQAFAKQTLSRDDFTMQRLISEIRSKEDDTPRFVYCHFLMPHSPYLFDKNGNRADPNATKEAQYISYLEYTNKRMLLAIDKILAGSATPSVILLMSDHGYRDDDNPKLSSDRFLNLNSIYLPGKNYSKYYKGISNVNMFRIFLNEHFKQQLPLLADSTVF